MGVYREGDQEKLFRFLDYFGGIVFTGGKERALASKHTARNLLAAAFSYVGNDEFGDARKYLERADREVKRLREEGCDDIDAPVPGDTLDAPGTGDTLSKKALQSWTSPLAWLRKRKEAKQADPLGPLGSHKAADKACEAPERSRSMMKFARKALVLLSLPVAGALAMQHSDKIASFMPDTGIATRAEFQVADACVACQALSDHAETPAEFCTNCGATEVKQIVAAKLHAGGWMYKTHVGWQLQDGQTLLLEADAEYEVPPLRVKSESTNTLTRF